MRADLPKLITMVAIVVITLCAVISTIVLLQMRQQMNDLYNVTAKPHCYLSPNDPRRRNIETQWGTTPTSQGICDKESQRAD